MFGVFFAGAGGPCFFFVFLASNKILCFSQIFLSNRVHGALESDVGDLGSTFQFAAQIAPAAVSSPIGVGGNVNTCSAGTTEKKPSRRQSTSGETSATILHPPPTVAAQEKVRCLEAAITPDPSVLMGASVGTTKACQGRGRVQSHPGREGNACHKICRGGFGTFGKSSRRSILDAKNFSEVSSAPLGVNTSKKFHGACRLQRFT